MEEADTKLVRFIPNYDLNRVFHYDSDIGIGVYDSTFIMRSLSYYRSVENGAIRDSEELSIIQTNGFHVIHRQDSQPYYLLVSCWCLYDKINFDEISTQFIPSNGVAIISTVKKVENLIKKIIKKCDPRGCRYSKGPIKYFANTIDIDNSGNDRFWQLRFMKRDLFQDEHEYRFVFDTANLEPTLIDTAIFYALSKEYIDAIIGIRITENWMLSNFCEERAINYEQR